VLFKKDGIHMSSYKHLEILELHQEDNQAVPKFCYISSLPITVNSTLKYKILFKNF